MTDESPFQHTDPESTRTTRIDFARRDLETARAMDLTQLESAGLILLIERLKTRLDDMLQLAEETDTE